MKGLFLWRRKQGLSQTQLGLISGVDSNLISRYERGETKPSLETLQKIALSLGISIDDLLRGPEEDVWELRIVFDREGKGVMDLTHGATSSATLEIGDNGMGITLSGAFSLWEYDEKGRQGGTCR